MFFCPLYHLRAFALNFDRFTELSVSIMISQSAYCVFGNTQLKTALLSRKRSSNHIEQILV